MTALVIALGFASRSLGSPLVLKEGRYAERSLVLEVLRSSKDGFDFKIYPYDDLVEPDPVKRAACRLEGKAQRRGDAFVYRAASWGMKLSVNGPFVTIDMIGDRTPGPPSLCNQFEIERDYRFDDGSCQAPRLRARREKALATGRKGDNARAYAELGEIASDCLIVPETDEIHAWIRSDRALLALKLGHPEECLDALNDLRAIVLPWGALKKAYETNTELCQKALSQKQKPH